MGRFFVGTGLRPQIWSHLTQRFRIGLEIMPRCSHRIARSICFGLALVIQVEQEDEYWLEQSQVEDCFI
jgi:hypothetical protein